MGDEEQIPGLQRGNGVVYAVAGVVLALPFLAIIGFAVRSCTRTSFATTILDIPIAGLDTAVDRPLSLPGGTELVFAVATGYEYAGNPVVHLELSLTKGSRIVNEVDCNMKGFTGVGGAGSGRNTWYGDAGWTCTTKVHADGCDAIRVRLRRGGKGSLTLDGTSVLVKKP